MGTHDKSTTDREVDPGSGSQDGWPVDGDGGTPPSWEVFVGAVGSRTRHQLEFALREGRVRVVLEVDGVPDQIAQPVAVVRGDGSALASTVALLRAKGVSGPVLAVGTTADRAWSQDAWLAGAIGIVDDGEGAVGLLRRVADVSHDVSVLPAWLCEKLMEGPLGPSPTEIAEPTQNRALRNGDGLTVWLGLLTRREWDVLRLVARGRSNVEIGRQLGIAGTTVKVHVNHILKKLRLTNRRSLMIVARRRGIDG